MVHLLQKRNTGEMDTQKLLYDIIGDTKNDKSKFVNTDGSDDRPVIEERLYAERIFQWGESFGLDEYICGEIGFEVILCNFLNGSVELISNTTTPKFNEIIRITLPVSKDTENGWPVDLEGTSIEDELSQEQRNILYKEDEQKRVVNNFNAMKKFDWISAGNIHDMG